VSKVSLYLIVKLSFFSIASWISSLWRWLSILFSSSSVFLESNTTFPVKSTKVNLKALFENSSWYFVRGFPSATNFTNIVSSFKICFALSWYRFESIFEFIPINIPSNINIIINIAISFLLICIPLLLLFWYIHLFQEAYPSILIYIHPLFYLQYSNYFSKFYLIFFLLL